MADSPNSLAANGRLGNRAGPAPILLFAPLESFEGPQQRFCDVAGTLVLRNHNDPFRGPNELSERTCLCIIVALCTDSIDNVRALLLVRI